MKRIGSRSLIFASRHTIRKLLKRPGRTKLSSLSGRDDGWRHSNTLPSSYNYQHFSKLYAKWYKEFLKVLPLGSKAPDFSCVDTDGKRVRLSDYRDNSIVVLEFGCMTCAPAMIQAASYFESIPKKLVPKYSDQNVSFLMVYTRETHPGEYIRSHGKLEEKLEHAKLFKQLENVNSACSLIVWGGKIHRKYGMLPNIV